MKICDSEDIIESIIFEDNGLAKDSELTEENIREDNSNEETGTEEDSENTDAI